MQPAATRTDNWIVEERPMFTVNIAVYNQLENIKVILEALKLQTFKNFEVSITDDGSSDGTKEYCQKLLEDRMPFTFRYLWQPDEGFRLAASKNLGIKEARGLYFLSLEGDVIPHPDLLAKYVEQLSEDTIQLGVRHEIKKLPSLPLDFEKLDQEIFSEDYRLPALKNFYAAEKPYMYASGCNLLLPTDALQRIDGWDEGYTGYGKDDYDVVMRLMCLEDCVVIPAIEAYCYHIDHPHGHSDASDARFEAKEKELGLA